MTPGYEHIRHDKGPAWRLIDRSDYFAIWECSYCGFILKAMQPTPGFFDAYTEARKVQAEAEKEDFLKKLYHSGAIYPGPEPGPLGQRFADADFLDGYAGNLGIFSDTRSQFRRIAARLRRNP